MGYQNEDKDHGWVRKVKYIKTRKRSQRTSAGCCGIPYDGEIAQETTKRESSNNEPRRSKKLVFKSVKTRNTNVITDSDDTRSERDNCCNEETVRSTPKRPIKVLNYGPEVNGYRFIAFDKEEIPQEKTIDKDNGDTESEQDTDEADTDEADTDDEGSLMFDGDVTNGYTYEEYLLDWRKIEEGGFLAHIPIPVGSNDVKDINALELKDFIKSKHRLKKERVRWHPDKMKLVLRKLHLWNEEIDQHITHLFQIINQLYEDF